MAKKKRKVPRVRPGEAPGSFVVDPGAPAPSIRLIGYGPDGCSDVAISRPGELKPHLARWPVVWVNVDGLGSAETLRELGEIFGLHRLALEDVVNLGQRAKVEPYDDQLFIVLRMPTGESNEQISLFLGNGYVLTFQERAGDCFEPVRKRVTEGKGRIRARGSDYLAYALIDAVIDSYFPILEGIADRLEALESEVFASPGSVTAAEVLRTKSALREIRRDAWPHADVAVVLQRDDTPQIDPSTRIYLRDCEDHATRVKELTDTYREMASDLTNAYLSSVSNRMNEVMKVLTIIASIFIPLSFIAGLYGMNFDPEASRWNMPELSWALGYPAALLLMALIAAGLLIFFRKKRWLD